MAYRLNDKTSMRAGYGRYVTPWNMNVRRFGSVQRPLYRVRQLYGCASHGSGRARRCSCRIRSRPPSRWFPLTESRTEPIPGSGVGLTYFNADRPRAYSNRVNISVQRQLPQNIILDVTYFLNRSSHITTVNYDINQVDPRIAIQYGAATNVQVANPFYHLADPQPVPGRAVEPVHCERPDAGEAVSAILGALTVIDGVNGGDMTYHSLQIKGDEVLQQRLHAAGRLQLSRSDQPAVLRQRG